MPFNSFCFLATKSSSEKCAEIQVHGFYQPGNTFGACLDGEMSWFFLFFFPIKIDPYLSCPHTPVR